MPNTETKTYTGLPISPGLAMGPACVYRDILQREHEYYQVRRWEVSGEWARIRNAIAEVGDRLRQTAGKVAQRVDGDASAIFMAQEEMLNDPVLHEDLRKTLEEELVNAEHVVRLVLQRWEERFQQLEREDLQQRGEDVADLARRLLFVLEGIHAHTLEQMPEGSVLVARRLLPSDTVFLSRRSTAAVVVEFGGRVSHAAILTRELGVPGVAQIPDLVRRVAQGDMVFVDGDRGDVVVRPDDTLKARLFARVQDRWSGAVTARTRSREPALTADGRRVLVMANVGCAPDVEHAAANGADGIGLYRTEHLYLSRQAPPSETGMSDNLRGALAPMPDRPVTLRLLDAGGDKNVPFLNIAPEQNPFLGRRGVRLLLGYPDLLRAQLRVFMRMSAEHDIRILVPMVAVADDMARVRELAGAVARELGCELPPLGAMIETPAAALGVSELARHADFFSIGTNDLTQYTMAASRENPAVSEYFIDDHAAVLRLIRLVTAEGDGRPVSVCGELAGRPEAIPRLLELGITSLSVAPPLIPETKECIRSCSGTASRG